MKKKDVFEIRNGFDTGYDLMRNGELIAWQWGGPYGDTAYVYHLMMRLKRGEELNWKTRLKAWISHLFVLPKLSEGEKQ